MNKLQEKLFEMFCWFHSFCEENHLRYYMLGGTMLGAVRHQGFIPWDDDIDVGMPRRDYEKLGELMNGRIIDGHLLEGPNSRSKDFLYTYSKLYDTHTTMVEKTRWMVKRGICIDIFPLDGIGNTEEESLRNYKKVEMLRKLFLTRVTYLRKGRKAIKNASVLLSRATRCLFSDKKLQAMVVRECRKRSFEDCKWVGNLVGAYHHKETMPREVLGKPTLYSFGGKRFYGAENADAYLKRLYGDWKKLPPEEKRVSHHDFIYVNLNESYLTT